MRLLCTGRQVEVTPAIRSQLEERLGKIHKILGPHLELEAHFILSQERHGAYSAEIRLRARHHSLLALGANHNPLTSVQDALERLEKQVIRDRKRRREIRRQPREVVQVRAQALLPAAGAPAESQAAATPIGPRRETASWTRAAGAGD
jgi:ribosomal subunit interface protein